MLAQHQHNVCPWEQGQYFRDIMEMLCKQMNTEKTKDKVFAPCLANTDVPKPNPQEYILNMHKCFLSKCIPDKELEAVETQK